MAAARLRRLPAWFLPVLALLALAAALLWLPPVEPAQAQDGSASHHYLRARHRQQSGQRRHLRTKDETISKWRLPSARP